MPLNLLRDLLATQARLRRLAVERNRLDAARARTDTRDWAKARRERTRHLIELGGLVIKADLIDLVDDDRATLLGAMMELAGQLRSGTDDGTPPADLIARWRRAGMRAFEADKEATSPVMGRREEGQPGMEVAE